MQHTPCGLRGKNQTSIGLCARAWKRTHHWVNMRPGVRTAILIAMSVNFVRQNRKAHHPYIAYSQ